MRRLNYKRVFGFIFACIILAVFILFLFVKLTKSSGINVKTKIEVNKEYKLSDVVSIKNGEINDEIVKLDTIGKQKITVSYKDKLGKEVSKEVTVEVVDNTPPVISLSQDTISIVKGSATKAEDVLKEYYKATDNSNKSVNCSVEGIYDFSKVDSYKLKLVCKDLSGNMATENVTVKVSEEIIAQVPDEVTSEYFVKINKTLNVAVVYRKENGKDYKIVKTFLVSAGGENTPVGVFTTTDRYETLSLVGGVWGHYTLRIVGAIWFHSVPYYSKPDSEGHWTDLEYDEYNKLGNTASKGCIRLAAGDAKWIYDNLPWHTQVEIYEGDNLPDGVSKPTFEKMDTTSPNKGWDPTDPDPANPWNL